MLPLFALTLFASAFLLFWIQPMFAKMVLPLLGGSPSVWNTVMVFFQATLLGGYLYADLVARRVPPRLQPPLHLGLLAAALLLLPAGVPESWEPPAASSPAPALLVLLVAAVGLPALVVSSTAPLVQRWFSRTRHAAARDPYFLYAASNLGSMLALLGYPTLIEPALDLETQSRAWTGGFAVLGTGLLGCGGALWWSLRRGDAGAAAPGAPPSPPPSRAEVGAWLALSFVPSSLLLGVTTHITTDVAAVPFLWVLPLALYLGTFVIVFSRRPAIPHRLALAAAPAVLLVLAVVLFAGDVYPAVSFPLHLLAFFGIALAFHGELAARRPAPDHLTAFYLWMAVGGVLGGVFNALLAPVLFDSVAEYGLVAAAAAFLRPLPAGRPAGGRRWTGCALPAAVFLLLWMLPRLVLGSGLAYRQHQIKAGLALACAVAVFLLLRSRRAGFGLGVAAILAAAAVGEYKPGLEHKERNFFGVVSVESDGDTRVFMHGHTLHGAQSLAAGRRGTPLAYHAPTGPLGEVFSAFGPGLAGRSIAIAGLGAGAMAAYGREGQELVFYELDPAVERIARDPRWFTFLEDSAAEVRVVIGDARLRIAEARPGEFAMLVVDVFSSDAVPVHLLTREALLLYLEKLAPGGVLVFHITNAFLDLQPVVHALAEDAGLVSAIRWGTARQAPGEGFYANLPSTWVVMARDIAHLTPLAPFPDWYRTEGRPGMKPWTDTFSNIFRVFRPW